MERYRKVRVSHLFIFDMSMAALVKPQKYFTLDEIIFARPLPSIACQAPSVSLLLGLGQTTFIQESVK